MRRNRNPMACKDTTQVSFDDALRGVRDMRSTLPYAIPMSGFSLANLQDLPLLPIVAGGVIGWVAGGLFPTRLLGTAAGLLAGYWWAKRQP